MSVLGYKLVFVYEEIIDNKGVILFVICILLVVGDIWFLGCWLCFGLLVVISLLC